MSRDHKPELKSEKTRILQAEREVEVEVDREGTETLVYLPKNIQGKSPKDELPIGFRFRTLKKCIGFAQTPLLYCQAARSMMPVIACLADKIQPTSCTMRVQ